MKETIEEIVRRVKNHVWYGLQDLIGKWEAFDIKAKVKNTNKTQRCSAIIALVLFVVIIAGAISYPVENEVGKADATIAKKTDDKLLETLEEAQKAQEEEKQEEEKQEEVKQEEQKEEKVEETQEEQPQVIEPVKTKWTDLHKPTYYGNYQIKHTPYNYSSGNSGRDWIVIHYTGNNTDTAAANANYFYTGSRGASAHLFVDDTYIYEVVGLDDTAWAVGRNFGSNNLFGTCNNRNSISIEMCSTNGSIADQTFVNTVYMTMELMDRYGIDASHVVRHYDVCTKLCPGWYGWNPKTGSEALWNEFLACLNKDRIMD